MRRRAQINPPATEVQDGQPVELTAESHGIWTETSTGEGAQDDAVTVESSNIDKASETSIEETKSLDPTTDLTKKSTDQAATKEVYYKYV